MSEPTSNFPGDPSELSWSARVGAVREIIKNAKRRKLSHELAQVLHLLAKDPKWEVRKEIADHLHWLDETDFASLAAALSSDDNAYVLNAVEAARAKRRRGVREEAARSRNLGAAGAQLTRLADEGERKLVLEAHAIAQKQFEALVGSTVHEMRSIVTAMKANVEQLRNGEQNATDVHAPRLARDIGRLEHLLDDLRTFTQNPSRERQTERVRDLITDALNWVTSEFKGSARDHSAVQVSTDIPDELTVRVSSIEIVITLRNLIKNAIEAYMLDADMFAPGEVKITARLGDSGLVEISIRDQGGGLNSDELASLREFLPGRTSKRESGTGFGLPIANRNILNHGGSLEITSIPDAGTQILVSLPQDSYTA